MIISSCGKCYKSQKSITRLNIRITRISLAQCNKCWLKQNGNQKHKFVEFEKTDSHCAIQSGLKLTVGSTITAMHNHY